ncbi:MAG: S53 family peptidase [Armatimonadetes bacterium]|nr:S53 family peptidase [Armatimonadota bacterium]
MLKRYSARVYFPVGLALAALLVAMPAFGQSTGLIGGSNGGVPPQIGIMPPIFPNPGGGNSNTRRLPGHIPHAAIARSVLVGPSNPNQLIKMAVMLPITNPSGLKDFLSRVYNPSDPLYGKYLTPAQFTAQFCPTAGQYAEVENYYASKGFQITGTSPNRLVLDVEGTASQVGAAFNLQLMNYRLPSGRVFYAPTDDPQVPASIANLMVGVGGLDNAAKWHPLLAIKPTFTPFLQHPSQIGTGPDGYLAPDDILHAYNLANVPYNGSGQTLGLFELDGYTPSDITEYENYFNLSPIPLQNVLIDGFSGTPGNGADEVTLDIEMMDAVARGASKIIVYEGPNSDQGVLDTYNKIATDNKATEISTSWGIAEDFTTPSMMSAEANIFAEMMAQGQSLYAAAGDSGAFDDGANLTVDDPASDPDVCGVGGTTLSVTQPGGAWAGETTWNEFAIGDGAGGGGVSSFWPAPSYQLPVIGPAWASLTLGSSNMRNVPDVALNADPVTGYEIYFEGSWYGGIGGTSAAAPLWAAFTALVNQKNVQDGKPLMGFPNNHLYTLGQSPSYPSAFHDIADQSTNGYYPAVPGYDDATGWGTFNGANFLNQSPIMVLLTPADVLGGKTTTGQVELQTAPTSSATLTIASDNPSVASVSTSTVTVPAGSTISNTFTITTTPVNTTTHVGISATMGSQSGSSELTVWVTLSSNALRFNPTRVVVPGSIVGTVTLPGPAPTGGAVITLANDDPYNAYVPDHIIIPAGSTTGTFFAYGTFASVVTTYPTVTATYGLTSAQASFAVLGDVWSYVPGGAPLF